MCASMTASTPQPSHLTVHSCSLSGSSALRIAVQRSLPLAYGSSLCQSAYLGTQPRFQLFVCAKDCSAFWKDVRTDRHKLMNRCTAFLSADE